MDFKLLVSGKNVEGSIKNWANNDTIPATTILAEGQELFYGGVGRAVGLRVRQMLVEAAGVMSTVTNKIAWPERYIEGKQLIITGRNRHELAMETPAEVRRRMTYDESDALEPGLPDFCADLGEEIILNCIPQEAYPYSLFHLARFAPLSEANPTNFLTDRAPYALRAACMAQVFTAYPYNEERRNFWLGQLDAQIGKLNEANALSQQMVRLEMRMG